MLPFVFWNIVFSVLNSKILKVKTSPNGNFLFLYKSVEGDVVVKVYLERIINEGGKGANGESCDSKFKFYYSACDYVVNLCLKQDR